jgi:hypothetical protein
VMRTIAPKTICANATTSAIYDSRRMDLIVR